MARGNEIIVTANPRGIFLWVYIGAGLTPKPGTVVQFDPTVALKGGNHTVTLYDRSVDGDRTAGPLVVLINDGMISRLTSTAYTAGEFAPAYIPMAGEELNMLVLDISGTGDDHTAGELLMIDDGTGKLVASTSSTGLTNPATAATLSAVADATSTLDSGTYFATYAWKKSGQSTGVAPTQAAGQAIVSGTNKLRLTIPAAPVGADGVDVYISTAAVGPYFRVRTDVTPATTIDVSLPITAAMQTQAPPSLNTTGTTPGGAPFMLLETITDPTADTLAWVKFSGSAG
jgi:hypothetical protein